MLCCLHVLSGETFKGGSGENPWLKSAALNNLPQRPPPPLKAANAFCAPGLCSSRHPVGSAVTVSSLLMNHGLEATSDGHSTCPHSPRKTGSAQASPFDYPASKPAEKRALTACSWAPAVPQKVISVNCFPLLKPERVLSSGLTCGIPP